MTDDNRRISRRALLAAAVGTVGGAVLGSATLAQARQVTFDRNERVSTLETETATDVSLRVAWKAWNNGEVSERKDETERSTDVRDSVLSVGSVLPGDSGKIVFGLSTEASNGNPPPMEVQMRVRIVDATRKENGLNEPEQKAGDSSPDLGELQDFLELNIWYDTGVQTVGVPLYGTCDGTFNAGDTGLETGSLTDVAVTAEAGSWWTLDTAPSNPVGTQSCLQADESLCVGLEWGIEPTAEDINLIQTDSVEFTIEFRARQCTQRDTDARNHDSTEALWTSEHSDNTE